MSEPQGIQGVDILENKPPSFPETGQKGRETRYRKGCCTRSVRILRGLFSWLKSVKHHFLTVSPLSAQPRGYTGGSNSIREIKNGQNHTKPARTFPETPLKQGITLQTWESPLLTGKAVQDLEEHKRSKGQKGQKQALKPA